MTEVTLSKKEYEALFAEVVFNAAEKLISASLLAKSNLAHREAFFLTIIAEEELSKLVMLPYIQQSGDYSLLTNYSSNNPFYIHATKQKIFDGYSLNNKDSKIKSDMKLNCLYQGLGKDGKSSRIVVKPNQVLDELLEAIEGYVIFSQFNVANSSEHLSARIKKIISTYNSKIFIPAIQDLVPGGRAFLKTLVGEETKKNSDISKLSLTDLAKSREFQEKVKSNPFQVISLVEHVLNKEESRQFFKKAVKLDPEELVSLLYKVIENKL